MFKLKVSKEEHKIILERLKLTETMIYDYVLAKDKNDVEDDKINIIFSDADFSKVTRLLDMIVRGEDLYVIGHNQFGQKSVEARNFLYFTVEEDMVFGILSNTRLVIDIKLYEIEELLSSKDFIRISKHSIVNLGKIDYIKPALNSKLDLLMKNGDYLEVNRGYYKAFKKALEI
ncbi:MAG: LytTR family DNA-binding domain-containing protein [Candidatus Izemoplasma sp.]